MTRLERLELSKRRPYAREKPGSPTFPGAGTGDQPCPNGLGGGWELCFASAPPHQPRAQPQPKPLIVQTICLSISSNVVSTQDRPGSVG